MKLFRRWLFGAVCRGTYLQHRAYLWANRKRNELRPLTLLERRLVQLGIFVLFVLFVVWMLNGDVNV